MLITLFHFSVNAQYTKLLDFTGANGSLPEGELISDGIFLYGMTYSGGTNDTGVVFKIKPNGTGYSKLVDFTGGINGSNPYGSLVSDGTFLYGMTQQGGTNNAGVTFKIQLNGGAYSKLHDFSYTDTSNGAYPDGSLISDGTFLYGMAQAGGATGEGIIFKIKPDGTGYSKLFNCGFTNGATPFGSLIFDGTFLYGMTPFGGANNIGVIFKMKQDGTEYTKLLDFDGTTNGKYPNGSLISDGTFLYGMTASGGTNDRGVIFKIMHDGTGYSKLLDFTGTANGSGPYGSLISDGSFLYGMTAAGGTNDTTIGGDGTIFKIKPDGTGYSKLLDFSGTANGATPYGSLISDGIFLYGMTGYGGTNDKGVIFKNCIANYTTSYDSIQNTFTLNIDSTITTSATGYHWDFADGTSSTLASPSHTYTADTVYNVCMKIYLASGDSCIYCHEIGKDYLGNIYRNPGFAINVTHANSIAGISQNLADKNNITVFPNPTSGIFTIISKENEYKLIITNVLGEHVYQSEIKNPKAEIDLSKYPAGIYFINITTEKGTAIQKLIINK